MRKIFIQQDRVKNHISEDDTVFMEALMEKGIKAKLYTQAANSLDIIFLDLGFFTVIQSFNNAVPKEQRGIDRQSVWHMKATCRTKLIIHAHPTMLLQPDNGPLPSLYKAKMTLQVHEVEVLLATS